MSELFFSQEVLLHLLIGIIGLVTGWFVRGICTHYRHRIPAAAVLLVAEAVITVQVVG